MNFPSEFLRRSFLGSLGAAAGLGVAGRVFAQPLSQPNQRRTVAAGPQNLILFFADELRADALANYGNPVTQTPNFDRLGAAGAQFRECHVQNPVCAQSRCSMLTGWPTSVRGHRSLYDLLKRDEPNLFRYLKQAGYDVFWFGKNDAFAPDVFADSVTEWHDLLGPNAMAMMATMGRTAPQTSPTTFLYPGGMDRRAFPDYAMVQMAIRILERREADRPFCIFLPIISPHPPYGAPQGFDKLYSPSDLPALVPPDLPGKPLFHRAIREKYGLDKVDDATFRKVRASYYGQVSYTDWLLGELMEALERTGRDKDTALIASSDHGDYAGDYGLVEKWPAGLESCLTHVPLLAKVPGGAPGVVSVEMVELFDIMATMLELGGARATHTHFARSLTPQIVGAPGDPHRAAFTEGGYNIYEPQAFEPRLGGLYGPKTDLQNDRPETIERTASIRTQAHTLVMRPHGQSELYDRKADPMETRNLIGVHAYATIQSDLQRRLLDWYIDTSGVPNTHRDPRDMPPFIRDPTFQNAPARTVKLLDD